MEPRKSFKYQNVYKEYYWDGIKYPSKIDNLKAFEKNNPTIAHDSLYTREMKLYSAYISKINSNYEKKLF